ncbi:hypothetical protein HYU40_00490 [Candidatus Woesearchaeota archaeon]|nr:hypothetical protein [Candidatus Woesearchaeota archaeon]
MADFKVKFLNWAAGALVLLGLAFLGFGRKSARYEEATGRSITDAVGGSALPIILIVAGVLLYLAVKFWLGKKVK